MFPSKFSSIIFLEIPALKKSFLADFFYSQEAILNNTKRIKSLIKTLIAVEYPTI